MNEIVITALPHPITTFVLGIMIVFAVITVFFLNRTMSKLEQIEKDNTSTKQDFQSHIKHTEKLISEVSRKVDSRIDKALGNINKG
jgi:predicted PurR-regulated permease PerM